MNPQDDFNKNMEKLLALLGKILKTQKEVSGPALDLNEILKSQKNINLNLCFVTFLPMMPEDMDDFEEMFEAFSGPPEGSHPPKPRNPELKFELSPKDMDFLKNNGIQF